jgi:hypothetical protein
VTGSTDKPEATRTRKNARNLKQETLIGY